MYRNVPLTGRFESSRVNQACMAEAIERAVNDVDEPLLTAYHLAKTRGMKSLGLLGSRSRQANR